MSEDPGSEAGWFWRIAPARRELSLAAIGVALMLWPVFQFDWSEDYCARWHWAVPIGEFFGGATIFGYSQFLPVRGIGCLAMLVSPFAGLLVLTCGIVI